MRGKKCIYVLFEKLPLSCDFSYLPVVGRGRTIRLQNEAILTIIWRGSIRDQPTRIIYGNSVWHSFETEGNSLHCAINDYGVEGSHAT